MKHRRPLDRRSFLKASLAGFAGAAALPGSGSPASSDAGTGPGALAGPGARGGSVPPGSVSQQAQAPVSSERPRIREYRVLGRTGFRVSDIAIGTSFLGSVEVAEAALDMGINYFDTGEHYGGGNSERIVGQAIRTRDRASLFVTTKLNLNFGGGGAAEVLRARFMKCLERLRTDYVDCLMIHMCTFDAVRHEGFHAMARELKAEGKIRFVGLSNHGPEQRIYGHLDEPMEKVLLAAAEDGRFDVALFVYNFLQREQGERIIRACADRGMGVTLMKTNPVKVYSRWKADLDAAIAGGRTVPDRTVKLGEEYKAWLRGAEDFKAAHGLGDDTEVRDAAIKFVLSNPGVHAVCASIGTFEDLDTFVKLSGGRLTGDGQALLAGYEATRGRLYCRHACGTCEAACPRGVPVNTILRYDHYFEAQGREKYAMAEYAALERARADACEDCAAPCEAACPHRIPVRSLLAAAHHNLAP